MFERLVVVSAEGEPTRRRAARTELSGVAGSSVDAAVDRWAQARLLTLDRHPQTRVPTVELAHEALLREWPRLRRWIEEDREAIIVLGHLRDAAASWDELERDPGALYRGARLEVALDVAEGRSRRRSPSWSGSSSTPAGTRAIASSGRRPSASLARRGPTAGSGSSSPPSPSPSSSPSSAASSPSTSGATPSRSAGWRPPASSPRPPTPTSPTIPSAACSWRLAAIDDTRSSDGTVLPEAEEALHRAVTASRILLSVPGVGGNLDWSPDGRHLRHRGPGGVAA